MNEALLTSRHLANLFSVKVSTIHRWAETRKIPSVKVFGLLRFRPADIELLLSTGFRPALDPADDAEVGGEMVTRP